MTKPTDSVRAAPLGVEPPKPSDAAAEAYYRAALADHLGPDEDIGDWGRNQVAHIKRRLALAYAVDFPSGGGPAEGPSDTQELIAAARDVVAAWLTGDFGLVFYGEKKLQRLRAAVARHQQGDST